MKMKPKEDIDNFGRTDDCHEVLMFNGELALSKDDLELMDDIDLHDYLSDMWEMSSDLYCDLGIELIRA